MTDRFVEGLDSRGVVGVALMVSLFILGCGSDAVAPTDSDAPVATTLTLSATVLSLSSVGATEQLTATVLDQNGATMAGASIVWASSASTVASVSPTGLVTAVADGPATITATSGSAAGTASVTVQQVPASITLSPSSLVLAGPADTATVTASVMDAGDSEIADPDLTWSSDDEDIATVGSSGLVTAVASGSATITVTSGGQMQTLSITVEEGALTDPAGGEVSLADDAVNLVFPAGALSEDVFITAEPATGLPAGPVPIPGTAFDFGPDGIVFTEPVTLTIAYDPEELRLHKLRAIDGFSVFVILGALGVTTTSPMADGTVDVEVQPDAGRYGRRRQLHVGDVQLDAAACRSRAGPGDGRDQRHAHGDRDDGLRGRGHECRSNGYAGNVDHHPVSSERHDKFADAERHGGRGVQRDAGRYGRRR